MPPPPAPPPAPPAPPPAPPASSLPAPDTQLFQRGPGALVITLELMELSSESDPKLTVFLGEDLWLEVSPNGERVHHRAPTGAWKVGFGGRGGK